MKKLLCLVVGVAVFISANAPFAMAFEVAEQGTIKNISIDADDNLLYIDLIKYGAKTSQTYHCPADSPIVPLIVSAYETQSTVAVFSREHDIYTADEMYAVCMNTYTSTTSADILDAVKDANVKSDVSYIKRLLRYAYYMIWRTYRRLR